MATTREQPSGQTPMNLSRYLKGIEFPAQKQDLLQCARQNHAEREVIDQIQRLDERKFDTMADVMRVFNQPTGAQKQPQQAQPQARVQGKQTPQHRR